MVFQKSVTEGKESARTVSAETCCGGNHLGVMTLETLSCVSHLSGRPTFRLLHLVKHKASAHLKIVNQKLVRCGQCLGSILFMPPSSQDSGTELKVCGQGEDRRDGSGVLGWGVVSVGVQHRASGPWAEKGGRTGRAALRSCGLSALLEAEQTWWSKA